MADEQPTKTLGAREYERPTFLTPTFFDSSQLCSGGKMDAYDFVDLVIDNLDETNTGA